nr:MAG TPA: hypothetical protein [Bacteriophage sp.]
MFALYIVNNIWEILAIRIMYSIIISSANFVVECKF